MCILYFESMFNTLKKIPSNRKNVTKKCTLFFSNSPALLLFDNSYMSWRTRFVFLKVYGGFSIFDFVSFLLKFVFVRQKVWSLWLYLNAIIPSKIKIIEKPHPLLLPGLWILSCNKKFENWKTSVWVRAPQKLRKSKSSLPHFFSTITCK